MKISHIQAKVNQYSSDGKRIISEAPVLTHFLHVTTPEGIVVINILSIAAIEFKNAGIGIRLLDDIYYFVSDPVTIASIKKFFLYEAPCNSLTENTKAKN
jgi:hypothetical protein